MSITNQLSVTSAVLGLSLSVVSSIGLAQSAERPELSGVWTNASRTGLTRPRGIEQLVVSAEEAEQIDDLLPESGIILYHQNGPMGH